MGIRENQIEAVKERIQPRNQHMSKNLNRFIKEGLSRSGLLLTAQIKQNIVAQDIKDQGHLLHSISFKMFEKGGVSGILVGSFNIPYARINEFGMKRMTERQKRGFAYHLAQARSLSTVEKPSKHVLNLKEGTWRARPYLFPAVKARRDAIIKLIAEAAKKALKEP